MKLLAFLAVLAAAGAILWFQVLPRLRTPAQLAALRTRLDAAGAGLWARLKAHVATWRTVILGFLGTAWMMLPELIGELQAAPWGNWLDAGWARIIGAALYLAMIMTRIHSPGPVGSVPPVEAPK